MTDEQDIKIAVMQSQIEGLRDQHRLHKEEITKSLSELAERVSDAITGIRNDIKDIYQFIHHSRGGIAVLLLAGSTLGGIVVAIVSWALGHFLR